MQEAAGQSEHEVLSATERRNAGPSCEGSLFFDDHVILSLMEQGGGQLTDLYEGRLILYPDRLEFYYGFDMLTWFIHDIAKLRFEERSALRQKNRTRLVMQAWSRADEYEDQGANPGIGMAMRYYFVFRGRKPVELEKYATEIERMKTEEDTQVAAGAQSPTATASDEESGDE